MWRFPTKKSSLGKYHNTKSVYRGMLFDSKKELKRYIELEAMEKSGAIRNIRRQVGIKLIPSQYKDGRCVERPVTYIADFVYEENGENVYEDTKGFKTPEYIIKRKLLRYMFGIELKEV